MSGATYTSIPPTCSTMTVLPFEWTKFKVGVQYADLSCSTAHDVQEEVNSVS